MNIHVPISQLQQLVTYEQYYCSYTSSPSAFSHWIKVNPRESVISSIHTPIGTLSSAFLCPLLLAAHQKMISEHLLCAGYRAWLRRLCFELRRRTRTKPRCSKPRIATVPEREHGGHVGAQKQESDCTN